MTNSNTQLTILSTTIRQDNQGRYCLNDCHKASGGDATKAPAQWLRNDQTKALIGELSDVEICTSPVSTKKGGTNQGTYACKELVYAYAMWISPKFHLQVIRAFDALVTGQIASQPSAVTIADIEQNMRSVMGGISKRVLGKGLEPVISTLEAQSTHIRLLEAKLDQVLMLLDRPAPNPNTVVLPYRQQVQAGAGDEEKLLAALSAMGGKASIRSLSRNLNWLASRRDAVLESLLENGTIAFERGKGTTPRGGRPSMGMVRLTQVPFHQTSA